MKLYNIWGCEKHEMCRYLNGRPRTESQVFWRQTKCDCQFISRSKVVPTRLKMSLSWNMACYWTFNMTTRRNAFWRREGILKFSEHQSRSPWKSTDKHLHGFASIVEIDFMRLFRKLTLTRKMLSSELVCEHSLCFSCRVLIWTRNKVCSGTDLCGMWELIV